MPPTSSKQVCLRIEDIASSQNPPRKLKKQPGGFPSNLFLSYRG
jgi:hypothetical protein